MNTNNPIAKGDKIYNELLISLAISGRPMPNFLDASVSLQTTPLHRTPEGEFLHAPEHSRSYVSGAVFQENDPDLQECLYHISVALQAFIFKKNL